MSYLAVKERKVYRSGNSRDDALVIQKLGQVLVEDTEILDELSSGLKEHSQKTK